MNKAIYSLALALLLTAAPVSAQESGIKARAGVSLPSRVKVETRASADVSARKASSTVRVEMQQSVVKRIAEHVGDVLAATADRLEKIMGRLESRIGKVKAEGGDVAASEGFLAEAKTHLAEARAKISVFASVDLSADKFRDNMTSLRAAAADVKEHLGEARRALMQSVRALKPGSETNNGRATSTATTTTQ